MGPSARRNSELLRRRLAAQRLTGEPFATPRDAVDQLGAVQAQDYAGAKWALGMRTHAATDASIEDAIDRGDILRTHVLRPTWHLVAARDLKWMLALTAPRIAAAAAYPWRNAGLDDAFFKRSNRAIAKALGGGDHLTRNELADALRRARIDPGEGDRMSHIAMRAELDAIACSGSRRGKQSTYALVDARISNARVFTRDEALRELAIRYFSTRGPATAKDFAWWSGLSIGDARKGVQSADDVLSSETFGADTMWFATDAPTPRRGTSVHLLPNYDEFLVAYADRTAMLDAPAENGAAHTAEAKRAIFSNVIEIGGKVAGTWQRSITRDRVSVEITPRRALTAAEHKAITAQAKRYANFLGSKAHALQG
jgi:hypothetical protein